MMPASITIRRLEVETWVKADGAAGCRLPFETTTGQVARLRDLAHVTCGIRAVLLLEGTRFTRPGMIMFVLGTAYLRTRDGVRSMFSVVSSSGVAFAKHEGAVWVSGCVVGFMPAGSAITLRCAESFNITPQYVGARRTAIRRDRAAAHMLAVRYMNEREIRYDPGCNEGAARYDPGCNEAAQAGRVH